METNVLNTKYESWKNKLLDLSKRNRLLNFRESKTSTVRITYPDHGELYNTFVIGEKAVVFPYPDKDPSYGDDETDSIDHYLPEIESGEPRDYGGRGSAIRTNAKPAELQKILKRLKDKAKLAVEEQGVNILYLSFGFLKYTEAEHSKSTFLAPLVLVPVVLSSESIMSPFVMKLHEDETVVNPTLEYMLESVYSVKLPEFDVSGSIDDYFDSVNETVKEYGWSVEKNVDLGLLSYLKINMYNDLEIHKDMVMSNPVVRALAGDGTALSRTPDNLSDYDFDKNDKSEDVFQIVDADASQQEAILLAKKGASFVLQGPPGTGKSQTITNIIAECLASGKKVLFVSEKMAALEVVYRRIEAAGLGDFCLVLHSQKTSKRNVLDQLEKVLSMAGKKSRISDDVYQKLSSLDLDRQYLNDYAEQIYTIVKPIEKSIYEVNGILANLENCKDTVFGIKDVRNTDRDKYAKYIRLLEEYVNTIKRTDCDFRSNPWRGAKLKSVTNEFRRDTASRLSVFLPELEEKCKRVEEIYDALFSARTPSLNGIKDMTDLLEGMENAVKIPYEWVSDGTILLDREIERCVERQTEINEAADMIKNTADILKANGVAVSVSGPELYDRESVSEFKKKVSGVMQHADPFFRWSEDTYNETFRLFSEAKEKAETVRSLRSELSNKYEDGVYDTDYEEILKRYKTEYTGIFKVFKSSYKADRKAFSACRKDAGRKITDAEILETIDTLKKISTLKKWYSDNEIALNNFFAAGIKDESSDYDTVGLNLNLYSIMMRLDGACGSLYALLNDLGESENVLKDHYQFLYNGIHTDWKYISDALKWAYTLREKAEKHDPGNNFVKRVCSAGDYTETCSKFRLELTETYDFLRSGISWFAELFDAPSVFSKLDLRELYDRLNDCMNGMSYLEDWIDYRTARENCCKNGLDEAISTFENCGIPISETVPVFKKRFFSLWLDSVLPEYPAVQSFRRKNHENTIREFSELDTRQFKIARERIRIKLINDLPSTEHFTNGQDEISILKREISKARRIMPVRVLFGKIPELLLTLKPCLMMSPLSVSLFLAADAYKFDTVIFDEASQVRTENAIGAIARGKQVIIAGDSKQLPPTNFFQTVSSDELYDSDDEDADVDAYNSVLDEAVMLPERTLRWTGCSSVWKIWG